MGEQTTFCVWVLSRCQRCACEASVTDCGCISPSCPDVLVMWWDWKRQVTHSGQVPGTQLMLGQVFHYNPSCPLDYIMCSNHCKVCRCLPECEKTETWNEGENTVAIPHTRPLHLLSKWSKWNPAVESDDKMNIMLLGCSRGTEERSEFFLLTVAGWSNNPSAGTTVLLGSAGTWKSGI